MAVGKGRGEVGGKDIYELISERVLESMRGEAEPCKRRKIVDMAFHLMIRRLSALCHILLFSLNFILIYLYLHFFYFISFSLLLIRSGCFFILSDKLREKKVEAIR